MRGEGAGEEEECRGEDEDEGCGGDDEECCGEDDSCSGDDALVKDDDSAKSSNAIVSAGTVTRGLCSVGDATDVLGVYSTEGENKSESGAISVCVCPFGVCLSSAVGVLSPPVSAAAIAVLLGVFGIGSGDGAEGEWLSSEIFTMSASECEFRRDIIVSTGDTERCCRDVGAVKPVWKCRELCIFFSSAFIASRVLFELCEGEDDEDDSLSVMLSLAWCVLCFNGSG